MDYNNRFSPKVVDTIKFDNTYHSERDMVEWINKNRDTIEVINIYTSIGNRYFGTNDLIINVFHCMYKHKEKVVI